MSLMFYFGSGSPYAWKVWLALEHKGVPFEAKRLSFDNDDTKTPAFLAINPARPVPAIVDDGFALWESSAIIEYLEERYPQNPLAQGYQNQGLRPAHSEMKPTILAAASNELVEQAVYLTPAGGIPTSQRLPRSICRRSWSGSQIVLVAIFSQAILAWPIMSPIPMSGWRSAPKNVHLVSVSAYGHAGESSGGLGRIEGLPYYAGTIPPHWQA